MKEILGYLALLLAMLAGIAWFAINAANFYASCDGAVVRGVFDYACVAKGNQHE